MNDEYAVTAEFYELTAAGHWEALRPALATALKSAVVEAGPVLDLGAGTGLSTVAIAVEPSAAMRAALGVRLGARST